MADFIERQLAFAAHLRDPARVPPPAGIEPRRMQIYRDLFINNVAGLLAGTFPVAKRILGDDGWAALVRRFYASHKAHTPYFLELPREFVEWLGAGAGGDVPPFLAELAHYEWIELALSVSEVEPPVAGIDATGDLLAGRPVLSPLAWPLAYRWPVQRLSVDFRPTEAPATPTFIVVHRQSDGQVAFLEIDAPTARLLELMDSDVDQSGREMLAAVAAEVGAGDAQAFVERGRTMLEQLRTRGIVLGTATSG